MKRQGGGTGDPPPYDGHDHKQISVGVLLLTFLARRFLFRPHVLQYKYETPRLGMPDFRSRSNSQMGQCVACLNFSTR